MIANYTKETLIEKASKKILSGDKHVVTICNSDGRAYISFLGRSAQIAYLRGYVECYGQKICITENDCPVNICCYNKQDKEWCVVFDKEGEYIMSTEDQNFSCNIIALAVPAKNQRYETAAEEFTSENIPLCIRCFYESRLDVKAASVIRNEQIAKIWFAESKLIPCSQQDPPKHNIDQNNSAVNNQPREEEGYRERHFEPDLVPERRW